LIAAGKTAPGWSSAAMRRRNPVASRDLNKAHKAVRSLEAGVIWVNCFDHDDMTQPFGGYKQSGQGRDKCLESLLEYTQTKSAWMHLG